METFVVIVVVVILVVSLINDSNKRSMDKLTKGFRPIDSLSNVKPFLSTPPVENPEMQGVRVCSVCGKGWRSTVAQLKDSGYLGDVMASGGSFTQTYSSANLMGLTCQKCGKTFCKDHLGQSIPSQMPGGSCPICKGLLDVA